MASSPSSDFSELQKPLDQFRPRTSRLKLHPLEGFVLGVVCVHLVFLPWALGGMRPWGQFISLGLAVVGLIAALVPRNYTPEHTGSNSFRLVMWPRLLKFPIFWIGLTLLALVLCHALNPSWAHMTDSKGWWMTRIPHVEWLPSGVRVPFEKWGPWRMLMIYATAWMVICTLWVGFTRRRTLQFFFLVLASNGMALACLGIAQKLLPHPKMFWLMEPFPDSLWFSSFVYKNHAGAYLFLSLAVTFGLAAWYYLRGLRRMEKSNPAGLFVFFSTVIAVSMLLSEARGATLTMFVFLGLCIGGFCIQQIFFNRGERRPLMLGVLVVVFGVFLAGGAVVLNKSEAWTRLRTGLATGGGDASFRMRQIANQASRDMLAKEWKMGVGSGGFGYIYPLYQQHYPEIFRFPEGTKKTRMFWWHAHNDWMQFPIEFGVPGMLLILAAGVVWAVALVRRYFWENALSLIVVFGACLAVAYSYFDFPFQNPSILILWCALWPATTLWVTLEDQRA